MQSIQINISDHSVAPFKRQRISLGQDIEQQQQQQQHFSSSKQFLHVK